MRILVILFFLPLSNNLFAQPDIVWAQLHDRELDNAGLITELIAKAYGGSVSDSQVKSLTKIERQSITYVIGELNEYDISSVIDATFVIFKSNDRAICLIIYYPEVLQSFDPNTYWLGGIHQYRGVGHYYVYRVSGGSFEVILRSKQIAYSTRFHCESFKNDKMEPFIKDLNDDGIVDLQLKGIELVHCQGSDHPDEKVYSSKEVEYHYFFDKETQKFIEQN
jgi:hypothetical protein